ncbi:DsbA family protein [Corynebacterium sp. ES2794-CONJ1]|uniref:DsbA family protein n=1 Tax=unclassified Corynebacterium TaxID=2624378 RepID=UPI002167605C|nr:MULTISPECIES: DsbA family protein [unclassified Corynebacterium]MCS4490626.1 DsbA family protein [Corynebacterium sp. ES2775-CONJ]MCS4532609.1 DsbA family protein [Corynebacterium sp. ES2730-CONJ]MCU9520003.1 DsbA family protein [Corynebacterium sp. ES2794-CONJ1]
MSNKIKNPNENSSGFIWAIVALVAIAIAVVGYIVVSGNNAEKEKLAADVEPVNITTTVEDNAVVLTSDATTPDAQNIEIYEDFSCSFCGKLATSTDEDMKKLVEEGKIVVHIRSLNFLDRGQAGHSTLAGTSAYTAAKAGDSQAYWNLRKKLLEDQEKIYGVWDAARMATIAEGFGAQASTAKQIESQDLSDEYVAMATANSEKLEKVSGKVSSPRVFIDGKEVGDDIFEWPRLIK